MIAVVGTGSIGRRHLQNLLAGGHSNLVAVSGYSRLRSLSLPGGAVPCVPSLESALAGGASIVFVCNPSAMHAETALSAIEAGAHVYLEKPAAVGAADLLPLIQMARRRAVTVAVGNQFRFHPFIEQMRRALGAGEIGTLLTSSAHLGEYLPDYHPGEDYRRGYAARLDMGGGVLLTQIHQLDVLVWLLGLPQTVAATAYRTGLLEVDVEECVTYLGSFSSGASVTGHLNYLQRPPEWTLEITGTDGSLRFDYRRSRLEQTAVSAEPVVNYLTNFDRNSMFKAAVDDFFTAIDEGRPPRSAVDTAMDPLRLVEAIKRSVISGSPEHIIMSGDFLRSEP